MESPRPAFSSVSAASSCKVRNRKRKVNEKEKEYVERALCLTNLKLLVEFLHNARVGNHSQGGFENAVRLRVLPLLLKSRSPDDVETLPSEELGRRRRGEERERKRYGSDGPNAF